MHSIQQPIYITGLGAIHCLGLGVQSLWNAVMKNQSGIQKGIGRLSHKTLEVIRTHLLDSPFQKTAQKLYQNPDHNLALIISLAAISEAMRQAEWDELTDEDVILFATTTGYVSVWEKDLTAYTMEQISDSVLMHSFKKEPLGVLLNEIKECLDVKCKTLLFSSACSASTQAIYMGSLLLQEKGIKRCLIGGTELLCQLTLQGFKSLGLLSESKATPFDQNRLGINLSEGSAFICLEKKPKNQPLAHISGGCLVSEAYHMTSPNPDGEGYYRCMSGALNSAKLNEKDISWIHAHGTGSMHNDLAEGKAIKKIFNTNDPWVSSTKAIHGHMLGASGVLESIICIKALENNLIPPTFGLNNPDENISIKHPQGNQRVDLKHILKNTAGFGGNNASLVLSKV